ncbi:MAG: FtsW/RodA/SpoVE family cell cycle protein [Patescibacteria group bacterium]
MLFIPKIIHKIARLFLSRDISEYILISLSLFGVLQMWGAAPEFALRQFGFFVFCLVIYFIAKTKHFRIYLKRFIVIGYILTLILLIGVMFTDPVKGARRWFNVYGISIQPSEFAKISVILMISYFISEIKPLINIRIIKILVPIILLLIPTILIFLQPDFGTAFLLFFTSSILIYTHFKFKLKEMILGILIIIVTVILVFTNLKDFQKQRIYSYIEKFEGIKKEENFNSVQAKIAIGSGGLMGKGLGAGTQSKLAFLPEDHTDFAFSSYSEQFGYSGVIILLSLLAILIVRFYKKINLSGNNYLKIALQGYLILFCLQVFINISMNLGIVPIVGVPLPLISYGGSSLLLWFFVAGLF